MNAPFSWGAKRRAPPSAVPADFGHDINDRAIIVRDLVKEFPTEKGNRRILDGINFRCGPGERIAFLGGNGAGKSTLIKLMAGLLLPTSGTIHRGLFMSWPLALGGGFEGQMTGYDNMRFMSRIYNTPFEKMLDFVSDFSELGSYIYEPVRIYSDGMRARLALGISLSVDFECMLIDEVLAVGDKRFQEKCYHEIFEKRAHCAMIMAIHSVDAVKAYCSQALVLKGGRGRVFDDVNLACDIYATF
ncbi:MAG: ABC transporter ATP-binding protein [Acetobacteraceae bacterium]|nr:ABC transporter ATP-binding protein [Acetobacteraceae bacterium]